MSVDKSQIINHYNQWSPAMENLPWFYDGVLEIFCKFKLPHNSSICDVGCGTGALLVKLNQLGYHDLTGVDIADNSVNLAKKRVPIAKIYRHDIEEYSLNQSFDILFLTTVIDFLPSPMKALQNIRDSLKQGGIVLISIRNRLAYWPLYHLRGFASLLPSPRLRHWFLWFTTPLGLRRNDQPYETVFSPAEARRLILSAGLTPIVETGFQFLPMLWIPDSRNMTRFAAMLDRVSQHLPGKSRYYYYLFCCSPTTIPE